MALFNYATKEITLKIVYYGPGLSGKTTNLQHLHSALDPSKTGKLLSLATETDRTLFFDFLPVELGKIKDFSVRFQLYTVPGQVKYNATRKVVLKGADAVVFVADSQREMRESNIESFQNMKENLLANNINPDEISIVLQYNKRDLNNIMTIEELNKDLNNGKYVYLEGEAINGKGVQETFQTATRLLIKDIARKHRLEIQPAAPAEKNLSPEPEKEIKEKTVYNVPQEKIPLEETEETVVTPQAGGFEERVHGEPFTKIESSEKTVEPIYTFDQQDAEEKPAPIKERLLQQPKQFEEEPPITEIKKKEYASKTEIPEKSEEPLYQFQKEAIIEEPPVIKEEPAPVVEETFKKMPVFEQELEQQERTLEMPVLQRKQRETIHQPLLKEIPPELIEKIDKISETTREVAQLLINIKISIKTLSEDVRKLKEDHKDIIDSNRILSERIEKTKKKRSWFGS